MTMTQDLRQKSPNEFLAEELVRGLLEAGPIPEDHELARSQERYDALIGAGSGSAIYRDFI